MNMRYVSALVGVFLVTVTQGYAQDVWSKKIESDSAQMVVIPSGQNLTLDVCNLELQGLMIHGVLRLDQQSTTTCPQGIKLKTDWLLVMGEGAKFEVGTESQPFDGKLTITLTGEPDADVHGMGARVFGAMMGGTIDLHGSSRNKRSWTQLASHALKGASSIDVVNPTNWAAGDRIVIAPSGYDPYEAEELLVDSVDGNNITFSPPLAHDHFGKILDYGGRKLDQRAEVGLLSRNIVIEGDERSFNDEVGGHAMFMNPSTVRVEGVEVRFMGQKTRPARYSMHWHLAGEGAGEYIKDTSIHHSFQRGIVTHGVDNVLIKNNVLFDINSHAMVPAEDGIEKNNSYINNLVVLTKTLNKEEFSFCTRNRCTKESKKDQEEWRASAFWLTNNNHTLTGNHVAGVYQGLGYFYDIRNLDIINPNDMKFNDNLAHTVQSGTGGNDRYPPNTRGWGVFFKSTFGMDKERQKVQNITDPEFKIERFTGYKNSNGGVWMERSQHVLQDSIISDSGSAAFIIQGHIRNTILIGQTENTIGGLIPNERGGIGEVRGQAGSLAYKLDRVSFFNTKPAALVFERCNGTDFVNSFARNISLHETLPAYFRRIVKRDECERDSGRRSGIVDYDGSLTGTNLTEAPKAVISKSHQGTLVDFNQAYFNQNTLTNLGEQNAIISLDTELRNDLVVSASGALEQPAPTPTPTPEATSVPTPLPTATATPEFPKPDEEVLSNKVASLIMVLEELLAILSPHSVHEAHSQALENLFHELKNLQRQIRSQMQMVRKDKKLTRRQKVKSRRTLRRTQKKIRKSQRRIKRAVKGRAA